MSIPASVTNESIEYSVTKVETQAFFHCDNITSITLPETVKAIATNAFYLCSSLSEVNVSPDNNTFCSVDGIVYSKNLETLSYCPSAKEGILTIPETTKTISANSFIGCENLTDIIIPESITTINSYAFALCTNLKSINIPTSVTKIGTGILSMTTSLEKITVADGNTKYCSEDGVLYDSDKTMLIHYPSQKAGEVVIPESVTSIGASAFAGCETLTVFTLPSRIQNITNGSNNNGQTFSACPNLTEIIVEDGNENYSSVNGVLFNKDQNMLFCYPAGKGREYIIPDGTTALASNSFRGATLSSVQIPSTISTIPGATFQDCHNLRRIINQNPNPQTITPTSSFYGTPSDMIVYVPEGSKEDFENAWPMIQDFREVNIFSVVLDSTKVQLSAGETLELKAEIIEMQTLNLKSETWSSSDAAIATVDQSGKVTALTSGSATITVTATDYDDNIRTAECQITVTPTSGISDVTADNDNSIDYSKPFIVYDLIGKQITTELKKLPAGVYIVAQGNKSAKIVIK